MYIVEVQQINHNLNYKANFVDSASLRKLRAELNSEDAKKLDSYLKQIKQSKNRNNFIFEFLTVRSKNIRSYAIISATNKKSTVRRPPVFRDAVDKALDTFKRLAESLK